MPTVRVQQFYEADDELHEFGGEQLIDFTDSELAELQSSDGEIVFLPGRNGHFGLIDQE